MFTIIKYTSINLCWIRLMFYGKFLKHFWILQVKFNTFLEWIRFNFALALARVNYCGFFPPHEIKYKYRWWKIFLFRRINGAMRIWVAGLIALALNPVKLENSRGGRRIRAKKERLGVESFQPKSGKNIGKIVKSHTSLIIWRRRCILNSVSKSHALLSIN